MFCVYLGGNIPSVIYEPLASLILSSLTYAMLRAKGYLTQKSQFPLFLHCCLCTDSI